MKIDLSAFGVPVPYKLLHRLNIDPGSSGEQAIRQGIALLKPGGTFVLIGIPETDAIPLPIHELRRKEILIINIRRQVHCTRPALDLPGSGAITLDALVTHRFPLEATSNALDLVARRGDGVMKAMIDLT